MGDGSTTNTSAYATSTHTHGNITNNGRIGSTSGLMIKTGTNGELQTLAAGSVGQYLQYDGTWSIPPSGENTTYTFETGTTNGAFSVTPSGGSAQSVSIFGLGTAAYTSSSDYALANHNHDLLYQALNSNLSSIVTLSSGSTVGLLRKNAENSWALDSSTYLTANQTITLTGAITGSGTTTINTTLVGHKSSHEAGGTDEIVGKVITTNITPSTAPASWAFGLNRINFVTSGGSITLPTNATYPFEVGTQIHFMSNTASSLSFATANNNAQGNKRTFAGQYAFATAIKTATDTWVVFGNLTA